MALYQLFFRRDGVSIGPMGPKCVDDLDALEAARTMCADYPVEIWLNDRFVARVKPGDEPLNVDDPHFG